MTSFSPPFSVNLVQFDFDIAIPPQPRLASNQSKVLIFSSVVDLHCQICTLLLRVFRALEAKVFLFSHESDAGGFECK